MQFCRSDSEPPRFGGYELDVATPMGYGAQLLVPTSFKNYLVLDGMYPQQRLCRALRLSVQSLGRF